MKAKHNIPEELFEIFKLMQNTYSKNPYVFAIDIGNRYDNGIRLDNIYCVRIHLNNKNIVLSVDQKYIQLLYDDSFGSQQNEINIVPNSNRTKILRTLQGGISVGSSNETGTLGMIVFDKFNNFATSILTCRHVIPGCIGNYVYQPALRDYGNIFTNNIGRIARFDSYGDSAIACLNRNRNIDFNQFDTKINIKKIREVLIGDKLTKSGRTTGITSAIVDGSGVFYKDDAFGNRRAIESFRLVPENSLNNDNIEISAKGDSGAIWYDAEIGEGIGLHFAGENSSVPQNEFAWAQHLSKVFDILNITLDQPK